MHKTRMTVGRWLINIGFRIFPPGPAKVLLTKKLNEYRREILGTIITQKTQT